MNVKGELIDTQGHQKVNYENYYFTLRSWAHNF